MTQKHGGIVCKYQNQNCMILIGEGEWCGVEGSRVGWEGGRFAAMCTVSSTIPPIAQSGDTPGPAPAPHLLLCVQISGRWGDGICCCCSDSIVLDSIITGIERAVARSVAAERSVALWQLDTDSAKYLSLIQTRGRDDHCYQPPAAIIVQTLAIKTRPRQNAMRESIEIKAVVTPSSAPSLALGVGGGGWLHDTPGPVPASWPRVRRLTMANLIGFKHWTPEYPAPEWQLCLQHPGHIYHCHG